MADIPCAFCSRGIWTTGKEAKDRYLNTIDLTSAGFNIGLIPTSHGLPQYAAAGLNA